MHMPCMGDQPILTSHINTFNYYFDVCKIELYNLQLIKSGFETKIIYCYHSDTYHVLPYFHNPSFTFVFQFFQP